MDRVQTPAPPPVQVAYLIAQVGRRRLDAAEAEAVRVWFAASHRAVRTAQAEAERAGADLFAALIELEAMRARWDGGRSALTPKPGATASAARALAAAWDRHWPAGGAR